MSYFEVEKISAVRKGLAHVFWKGYDASQSTWEPLEEVKHTAAYEDYYARKTQIMSKARKAKAKKEEMEDEEEEEAKKVEKEKTGRPFAEPIDQEDQDNVAGKMVFLLAAMGYLF